MGLISSESILKPSRCLKRPGYYPPHSLRFLSKPNFKSPDPPLPPFLLRAAIGKGEQKKHQRWQPFRTYNGIASSTPDAATSSGTCLYVQ